MKDEYEQIDLIGKKTQRTATTVQVSDSAYRAVQVPRACGLDERGSVLSLQTGVWNDFARGRHKFLKQSFHTLCKLKIKKHSMFILSVLCMA